MKEILVKVFEPDTLVPQTGVPVIVQVDDGFIGVGKRGGDGIWNVDNFHGVYIMQVCDRNITGYILPKMIF